MALFNTRYWNLYKDSEEGKKVIAAFKRLTTDKRTIKDAFELARRFNPDYFSNFSENELQIAENTLGAYFELVHDYEFYFGKTFPGELEALQTILVRGITQWFRDFADVPYNEQPQQIFKALMGDQIILTLALFCFLPKYYLPNFFPLRFQLFRRFVKKYDLEMPPVPKRTDYRARMEYCLEVNAVIRKFLTANGITSPAEMCAYIYGLELPDLLEEERNEKDSALPETAEQAWFLVGSYGEGEAVMQEGIWQANPMTTRGDIMVFYEKSPVMSINSIWIANVDGVADPFFWGYGYTFIGNKIDIPAITLEELRADDYFVNHSLVRKNFQGGSGWPLSDEDYRQLKRMLQQKGFDTSVLPMMFEPTLDIDVEIKEEADVSQKLLRPLLEEMGWEFDKDFFGEVEFPAGHSTTGYGMNKRPDFCLHLTGSERDRGAKVVIEVKEFMKGKKELEDCFYQGLSYAKWGNPKVFVICDKTKIIVYEKDRNGNFHPDSHRTQYRWAQLKDREKFIELKRKFDI